MYEFINWHHIFTQLVKYSDSFSGRKIQTVTYPSSVSFAYAGLKNSISNNTYATFG